MDDSVETCETQVDLQEVQSLGLCSRWKPCMPKAHAASTGLRVDALYCLVGGANGQALVAMRVLVTGATSMIGDFLLPMLVDVGHTVVATNRFTKGEARNSHDRHLARLLADGESKLEQICTERGTDWTIFRPTLIYCLGWDRNLTPARDFIVRFSFFPLIGGGSGLRQPVHAGDLAMACMQAMESRASINQTYDFSGGEVLSYRDMVAGVFRTVDKRPLFCRFR